MHTRLASDGVETHIVREVVVEPRSHGTQPRWRNAAVTRIELASGDRNELEREPFDRERRGAIPHAELAADAARNHQWSGRRRDRRCAEHVTRDVIVREPLRAHRDEHAFGPGRSISVLVQNIRGTHEEPVTRALEPPPIGALSSTPPRRTIVAHASSCVWARRN